MLDKIAPISKRIYAYMLDFLFVRIMEAELSKVLPTDLTFLLLVPNMVYFIGLTISPWQATLGQKLMNIHVMCSDHSRIPWVTAMDRHLVQLLIPLAIMFGSWEIRYNLNFTVSSVKSGMTFIMLVILYGGMLAWYGVALFNKQRQTIHDIIYKTFVVNGSAEKAYKK